MSNSTLIFEFFIGEQVHDTEMFPHEFFENNFQGSYVCFMSVTSTKIFTFGVPSPWRGPISPKNNTCYLGQLVVPSLGPLQGPFVFTDGSTTNTLIYVLGISYISNFNSKQHIKHKKTHYDIQAHFKGKLSNVSDVPWRLTSKWL